jgi:transposase
VQAGQATFRSLILLLCSVPGLNVLGATIILAEIGRDISRFPPQDTCSRGQACARARTRAPASAHPHVCAKARPGSGPWAATRKKDSYYEAQCKRLRARRGPKKAICAVAASMLTAIYHMLKDGTYHRDLGADHFDRRSSEVKARHHVAQLARLGFHVELQPAAQAA